MRTLRYFTAWIVLMLRNSIAYYVTPDAIVSTIFAGNKCRIFEFLPDMSYLQAFNIRTFHGGI
jgi:hypothetical protein